MNDLETLEYELIRAKQLRGLLGQTINGWRYPYTGNADEIKRLQDEIYRIKVERGLVEVQDDDF